MILNLSDISDEPLQGQIVRQIRAMILSGDLSAGEPIASIRKLARDNHVSIITVQRAYEKLEREGLIHSRRGKGFYISDINKQNKKEIAKIRVEKILAPLIETALSEGLTPEEIQNLMITILKNKAE